MTIYVTQTVFAEAPTRVLKHVHDAEDVVVLRPDGSAVRASVDVPEGPDAATFATAVEVVTMALQGDKDRRLVTMSAVFPWAQVLTASELTQFADDYFAMLRACASLRSFALLAEVEATWRATAEMRADPARWAKITHLEDARRTRALHRI